MTIQQSNNLAENNTMTMDTKDIIEKLKKASSIADIDSIYYQACGKQGTISLAFRELKSLSPEEKKKQGQLLKEQKESVEKAYKERSFALQHAEINQKLLLEDPIDISVDKPAGYQGYYNLLTKERRHVEKVAKKMGLHIEYGHDVVSKYENFYSVNIPSDHPATEMQDTIYMKETTDEGENYVLRTHTSAHQVQYMKQHGIPLHMVCIGRVYRYEKTDASHDVAFRQIEGMVIDKGISTAHFKGFMEEFLSELFEEKKEIRLRPGYFPFVEPGYEIDVKYNIGNKTGDDNWMELLGAGMIHPNVLKEGGVDPDVYSGFAFGLGLTRLVAVKYGIKDIRLFTNGDLRFVKSF